MTTKEFEKLVIEALKNLPTFFKEKLDNVDVVVEDWPSQDLAKGRLLLGLYQGVPKLRRGGWLHHGLTRQNNHFQGPNRINIQGRKRSNKEFGD